MEIKDLRQKIDAIDVELCKLFSERMKAVAHVAGYKRENSVHMYDNQREKEILARISKNLGSELEAYGRTLYHTLFDLSHSYETRLIELKTPLFVKLSELIHSTPVPFPKRATVACQGCEGAYSQIAADRLFEMPEIMFNNTFDGVFRAVSRGLCEYGILPIENSSTGSVNEVYDLLVKYNVSIVRSLRVKTDHALLVLPGTELKDIKIIYSHHQAIGQCSQFLDSLKDVRIIPCENTAVAARNVALGGDKTHASLSSRICAELYGLKILTSDIQNRDNNYTRFICISRESKIFPGADRTSIMMVIPNKPGTLFQVLSKFNAIGANLVKLESRPVPNKDFEFIFYFDIEASVYDERFTALICQLETNGEQFKYFGTYSEVF